MKNEIKTIDVCLKSILPVIKKGVIGYNDCDDGTEEYILEFCKKNKGFIPFKYPYSIYSLEDKVYLTDEENEKKFHTYSNTVLSKIPKNEWLIKIDCDHVYDAEKLKKLFSLIRHNNDCIIISKLNMHYDGENIFVFKKGGFNEVKDHWIIKNKNLKFTLNENYEKAPNGEIKFTATEVLKVKNRNLIFSDLTNWHFPYIKQRRENIIDREKFITLDEFKKEYPKNKITEDMLNENRILEICKKFNLENKRILP